MTPFALGAVSSLLADAPVVPSSSFPQRLQSVFGLVVFCLIAWGIGRVRGSRGFPVRVVGWGVVLGFAFGATVVYSPWLLRGLQDVIQRLLDFSNAGAELVFRGILAPNDVTDATGKPIGTVRLGFVFAITVLATIIFISMLTAVLYHLGILTWVVNGLAWVMQKTMGTSGAETLSTAANIFVGQTEAPLFVKPFLAAATRSELTAIMVGGFANIASGVLVVYTDLLKAYVPDVGGHLAAACFVSAPMTLVVAKLIDPERAAPVTAHGVSFKTTRVDANVLDAATRGTTEGMALAINVVAMLIAFTALVTMLNAGVGWVGEQLGFPGTTMQGLLGYALAPFAWLAGVSPGSAREVGSLLALKTVLNEFIAYAEMGAAFAKNPNFLPPRDALVTTYALCGFANFASVGIQIGGISTMAPERRHDLSRIGLLAMLGGALASLMGACVVGVLI
jgi:CNT family concentrative nucleoside transporter